MNGKAIFASRKGSKQNFHSNLRTTRKKYGVFYQIEVGLSQGLELVVRVVLQGTHDLDLCAKLLRLKVIDQILFGSVLFDYRRQFGNKFLGEDLTFCPDVETSLNLEE